MPKYIVEAQEYKTKKQVSAVQHSCHSKHGSSAVSKPKYTKIAGWFHIGYLRILFTTEQDALEYATDYRQSAYSLNTRLVAREYCDEYLSIDKPYYENIERLRSNTECSNTPRVQGLSGYMLEMQLERRYYVALASRGTKYVEPAGHGNWCHLSYGSDTFTTYAAAVESICEQEQIDVETLGEDTASMIRYVVRTCYGEVRQTIHTYGLYDNSETVRPHCHPPHSAVAGRRLTRVERV